MKNMKRSVALLVAIALLIGCAAGGTMAWLTMKTQDVVNTFTVGLFISFFYDIPAGASVVIVNLIIFVLMSVLSKIKA